MFLESLYHASINAMAYRIVGSTVEPIEIRDTPPPPSDIVPLRGLIEAKSGWVEVPSLGWVNLSSGGLYRLHSNSGIKPIQWIVFDGNLDLLAGSVSSIFYHAANEPIPPGSSQEQALTHILNYVQSSFVFGKVAGVCLTMASFFASVCERLGYRAITWQLDNYSHPNRSFATHAMTEVFDPARNTSVLYDIDRGNGFAREDGSPVSFGAFVAAPFNQSGHRVAKINARPYSGFGKFDRYPQQIDFITDLYALCETDTDQYFYTILSQSEVHSGSRNFAPGNVTTTIGRRRVDALLKAGDNPLVEKKKAYLDRVRRYDETPFA